MRVLLLLRGSAGCGKSTWIEQNGLKPYTLSADDIRLLCQSPVLQVDGTRGISQNNDGTVWKTLFSLLEIRMQKGEFTVIDATNSKTSEINRYKNMCETYRYRMYCVDFTDIPIEEVKRRNAGREEFKRVSDDVIDKMYSRFATQKIPSGITVIKPDELDSIWMKKRDFSQYKRIHHIGDVHGCYTALMKYLDDNGGIKDDEFYIFTGDYIDRGVENAEVVNFLISIMDRKNVLMLEGNHERWLWLWANDCTGRSKEFELVTRPILDASGIDKKEVRKLYRRFGQCAYYSYGDNVYLVTHAGLSVIPDNLTFVATDQMIHGVGAYNDFEKIAETFYGKMPANYYQIHGHRNTKLLPVRVNDRVFNLEGRVEYGGELRCVRVDADGIHEVEIHNDVFKAPEIQEEQTVTTSSVADVIISLRGNRYIQEKTFGNISSFNFTSKAFNDRVWDEQTTRARGLYIDTFKGRVAARAYDKFFNINERPETKFDMLQNKLQFPVTAYVKESNLYLLDIVYNQINYAKYDYDAMCDTAHRFGLTPKKKACELATWQEFYDWYYDILEDDYEYNGRVIEGFVIEDSAGYMTKLKLAYYNFWKFMRTISYEAIRNGYIKKTSALTTPLANEYYAWVRKLHDTEDPANVPRDICTLRRWFYNDMKQAEGDSLI